ncbi:MAG: helix-turn-helix domain-containing protein [Rubrobacteraceae bacterium]|nr:helix-turn-helix domain-containing protein [Rubrobacteraceae bacterium]
MVRIMHEIEVTRPQQAVLLAMAEHANDDGTNCYPSVDRIAWKAGYKPRAVEDIMRSLRQQGIIRQVAPATGSKPPEYEIHLEEARRKMSFEEWRERYGKHRGAKNAPVHSDGRGVQSHEKTTRENAPEPSDEPSIEPSEKKRSSNDERKETAVSLPARRKVKALSRREAEERWERLCEHDRFGEELRRLAECAAAENKTGTKAVSALWREIGERYVSRREKGDISEEAWAYGFEEALRRSKGSIGYVIKCAQGYRPDKAARGQGPAARRRASLSAVPVESLDERRKREAEERRRQIRELFG